MPSAGGRIVRGSRTLHIACIAPALWEVLRCPRRQGHDLFSTSTAVGKGEEERTWWDFELRGKLDRLAILDYVTRDCVVNEALEVDDEYRWKCFNEHCDSLARFAWVRWLGLHGL
jgi:hypothetical protein